MAQPVAGMTRIVLETKANSTFSVSLEPNPYRLVVEVRKIGANPKGAVNLFPNAGDAEKNKLAIVVPPPTKEDMQLRARVPKMRIVVDAGHGGWDLGTVGRRGLLEKDLVLEISQRLGKLLESRLGMEVIYTRPDDNYITLDERASIANRRRRICSSPSMQTTAICLRRAAWKLTTRISFLLPAPKMSTLTRARLRRSPLVAATLSPADLHERIEQSRRLAASVQRSLYGTLSAQNPGLRDRGIKEAGFVVLTESAMPGILAEVSFVSSPTDEQKLRSDGYREANRRSALPWHRPLRIQFQRRQNRKRVEVNQKTPSQIPCSNGSSVAALRVLIPEQPLDPVYRFRLAHSTVNPTVTSAPPRSPSDTPRSACLCSGRSATAWDRTAQTLCPLPHGQNGNCSIPWWSGPSWRSLHRRK